MRSDNRGANPFGENENEEEEDTNPFGSGSGKSARQPPGTNPFGDSSPKKEAAREDPFLQEMRAKNPPQFKEGPGRSQPKATPPPPRPPARSAREPSNPFGDAPAKQADRPPSVPKPLISQSKQMPQQQARSAPPNSNPYGSDGPMDQRQSSPAASSPGKPAAAGPRKRFGAFAGKTGDTDSTRPILSAMDEESLAAAGIGNSTSANAQGLTSWLRRNKTDDDGAAGPQQSYNSAAAKSKVGTYVPTKPRKAKAKKKCSIATPWPFDNYHEVQREMYEELASRAASDYGTLDGGGRANGGERGDRRKEERMHLATNSHSDRRNAPGRANAKGGKARGGGATSAAASATYYERPDELPSIKEAVTDLPLAAFERKAEERAINIVSTWLFDAGLIDELLVNGAAGPPPPRASAMPSGGSVASHKTSEGQEVGAHGFLVGADGAEAKMDKETRKLRAMVRRDLSIIDARLNDGVAASGLEVAELVSAVSRAQDDLGRLRELTTYLSDGRMSDRDEFLLADYPHLRRAIHARRNLHRTFRELDFFAHIPATCERLRDELHGGEWTAEEWATIRNVSREHVELEVMLVEAEGSMKGGDDFSDDAVDAFLGAHVHNVWELGEEIRVRILSGIGAAFELSIDNPAGMVALVEAVEVYERAAEAIEKKRGRGDDGTKLRFTNMRAAALEQLYQDFELRGVEMFRGVHEHVSSCTSFICSVCIAWLCLTSPTCWFHRLPTWPRRTTRPTPSSPPFSRRPRSSSPRLTL